MKIKIKCNNAGKLGDKSEVHANSEEVLTDLLRMRTG